MQNFNFECVVKLWNLTLYVIFNHNIVYCCSILSWIDYYICQKAENWVWNGFQRLFAHFKHPLKFPSNILTSNIFKNSTMFGLSKHNIVNCCMITSWYFGRSVCDWRKHLCKEENHLKKSFFFRVGCLFTCVKTE